MDQEADARDDEQHHGRERVDEDARVDLEVAAREPVPAGRDDRALRVVAPEQVDEGEHARARSPASTESEAAHATARRDTLGPTPMLKASPTSGESRTSQP